MSYKRIHGPDGRLLFEFDEKRELVRIKPRGYQSPIIVDLTAYRCLKTREKAEIQAGKTAAQVSACG